MEDMRAIAQQRRQVGVLQPRLDEPKPRVLAQRREIAFLRRSRVVIDETVDADDFGAVGEETLGERRSDETGRAGDQSFHENNVRTRSGNRRGRPPSPIAACTVMPVASLAPSAARTTS
jgi:hypothetical protein